MIGIKIDWIYIYHFDARFSIVYSFLFIGVDPAAPGTPP